MTMLIGAMWTRIKPWVERHDVLNFGRHPLARGVAFGLFCGLIPGPLQVAGTLLLCAKWRGNFIAGIVATAYTNPLTIVPLYALALQMGQLILPGEQSVPKWSQLDLSSTGWFHGLLDWVSAAGWPLGIGVPVLALLFAVLGYLTVQFVWLYPVLKRARRIKKKRALNEYL